MVLAVKVPSSSSLQTCNVNIPSTPIMPFLRRRGVMASDNDIRRHTLFDSRQAQSSPRKSLGADSLLNPESATNESTSMHGQNGGTSRRDDETGDSLSRTSTSGRSRRSNGDFIARPESPAVQEETSKHRRFSMLRFRNASDSQLSARLRHQQQQQQQQEEQLPPVPHREFSVPLNDCSHALSQEGSSGFLFLLRVAISQIYSR